MLPKKKEQPIEDKLIRKKKKRKRPRAAAVFEGIATTIETSLSSMEDRFAGNNGMADGERGKATATKA